MARLPRKKKWPKGLPKPGTAAARRLADRIAENKKIETDIEKMRKLKSR